MNPAAADVLLQRPWLPVSIDGCRLLAKSWFGEAAYRVLLTDLHSVWEERMEAAAIEGRAQELNRRLRASVGAFFSHLREVAEPCLSGRGGAQISVGGREDGNVTLRLKSELVGLPFHWEFRCSPAPVALVCLQLVRPLLAMSRLLQRQADELGELLERKDEEIQDYRENGATLSRERLQTDVFDKQLFTEDFIQQTLPLLWPEPPDALGFGADLQRLYDAVVAHGTARKRKRPEEAERDRAEPEPEPPGPTSAPDVVSVGDEPPMDRNRSCGEQVEPPDTRNAITPAAQTKQLNAAAAPRPAQKPKKKKVGLFR